MFSQLTQMVFSELQTVIRGIDAREIERFEALLCESASVICHGMGRSGLNAKAFAMRLMHLGMNTGIVGDALCPPIREGDLLLIISASASSLPLLSTAQKAVACGAKLALVTSSLDTQLCSFADVVIHLRTPTKMDLGESHSSVMPMGTLFEETSYLLLDLVVLDIMQQKGITNDSMVKRHANLE